MRATLILPGLILCTPALAAAADPTAQPELPHDPVPQAEGARKAHLLSDTPANWFHIGGGAGFSGAPAGGHHPRVRRPPRGADQRGRGRGLRPAGAADRAAAPGHPGVRLLMRGTA